MSLSVREYRALLRSDFHGFVDRSFNEVNPGTEFLPNWHLEVIADRLEKCRRSEIKRLIINVPPRSLKSFCASVAFPAFLLGHDPSAQIICASYSQDLANKHAVDCRALMKSPFYQKLFPSRLSKERQAITEFGTTKGGFRMATSVGGTLTGRGADFIILDDVLKPEEAISDVQRSSVNAWYDGTLYSRMNDKSTGCIIIIMQRLHEDDLVGHVLGREHWEVLRFPAIAEEEEIFNIQPPDKQFTRRIGEALHPEREPLAILKNIRETLGEYNFASQYQQAPAPLGGGMVKSEWFKSYTESNLPSNFEMQFQSWDTANKPTQLSDYSVCTTWGVKDKHLYLLNVFRKRLSYPDLKRAVRDQSDFFNTKTILIEDKASGTQLIQDLITEGIHGVQRYEPLLDKIMRMNSVTSTIENGFVHLPERAHWLAEYVHELVTFPRAKYDDQADSTSQALDWFKRGQHMHGLVEYWRQQYEARTTVKEPIRKVCPQCGAAVAVYSETWRCYVCNISGPREAPVEPTKCPNCRSTLVARIGAQWRCQQCGKQWGQVDVQRAPARGRSFDHRRL
jgi:predicted phage terminase large subunit-like protein